MILYDDNENMQFEGITFSESQYMQLIASFFYNKSFSSGKKLMLKMASSHAFSHDIYIYILHRT